MRAFLLAAVLLVCAVGAGLCQDDPPAKGDIELTLAISVKSHEVGETIPYELKLKNISTKTLSVVDYPRLSRILSYSIRVTDPTGGDIPMPAQGLTNVAPIGRRTIKPGDSTTFIGFINAWAILDKPGACSVTARWKHPDYLYYPPRDQETLSEPITLQIAESSEKSRDARLKAARKQLAQAKTHESKLDAIAALSYTLDQRAIADIIRSGRNEESFVAVDTAVRIFGDLGAVRSQLITELTGNGPYSTCGWLLLNFQIPHDTSGPILTRWLAKGDTAQRAAAWEALSMFPKEDLDPSLKEPLLRDLRDHDARMRREAVLMLIRIQVPDAYGEAMRLAKDDPDDEVRDRALAVLRELKDERAVPFLKSVLLGSNATLHYNAITALAEIGSDAAISALKECVGRVDEKTRKLCEEVLDRVARNRTL